MEKPEIPKLKITSPQNCEFLLNLYRTYTREEIREKEKYYIRKISYLRTISYLEKMIFRLEDRLDLFVYEEERRSYEEFLENLDPYENDDNNLDQFDTEYWFNDED